MKIQNHLTDKRGDKTYYNYVIVVPPDVVEKAGFKEGEELEAESKKGEIKLKKK
jgi:hypothetical protein